MADKPLDQMTPEELDNYYYRVQDPHTGAHFVRKLPEWAQGPFLSAHKAISSVVEPVANKLQQIDQAIPGKEARDAWASKNVTVAPDIPVPDKYKVDPNSVTGRALKAVAAKLHAVKQDAVSREKAAYDAAHPEAAEQRRIAAQPQYIELDEEPTEPLIELDDTESVPERTLPDGSVMPAYVTEPGARRPVSVERSFSNEQDKAAYLERVRRAMENAGVKK